MVIELLKTGTESGGIAMKKGMVFGLAAAIFAGSFPQLTHAEPEKPTVSPSYLLCDGIIGDEKEARTFKVEKNSISLWNKTYSRWDIQCDENFGHCAIDDKTIAYSSNYSIMVISRATGQFEGHLSSGATWIGACTKADDPILAGVKAGQPRPVPPQQP